jgi:hypothetical protein
MNSNKKLCCCNYCLNKSNSEGIYVTVRTWNRHQKDKNLFEELENDSSSIDSLMSVDDKEIEINYDGILKKVFLNIIL